MHKISIFKAVLIALLLLLGVTGVVSAQGPVSTTFTYQGSLDDGDSPANGVYDFEFNLYNVATGGGPLGGNTVNDQTVTDGLFSVELDFGGPLFTAPVTDKWLQINVRPGDSTGDYTALSPRQRLTATPLAMYALDGWGGSWTSLTGTDTGLTLSGGQTGLNASGTLFGVYGVSDAFGVYGDTYSNTGVGVRGYSNATTGTNYGVKGKAVSPDGFGVYGEATATSGINYGVSGKADSPSGFGVYGEAPVTGVYGVATATGALSNTPAGVKGIAQATNGLNYGVYGETNSNSGNGVYGWASKLDGFNVGVYGRSSSVNGTGVYGGSDFPTGYAGKFNGNVYVGDPNLITSAKGKVEIVGSQNFFTAAGYGFLNTGGAGSGGTAGNFPFGLYSDSNIAADTYVAFSDERMKQIKGRSDAAQDLVTLAGIEVTDYTYIDTVTKGTDTQKKVIAQQVETVYPQAVSRSTDTVPDIYQKATIKDGWVMLATDLQQGERVRLIGENTQGIYEVLEVVQDGFRTDFVADGDEVFIYGREVEDFRNVDYEAIAMLNVSATQELNRLVQQQAAEIEALKAEKEALNTRLAALEQAVSSIDAAAQAESNSPLMPWLFGGLGIVGLGVVAQRRAGGKR